MFLKKVIFLLLLFHRNHCWFSLLLLLSFKGTATPFQGFFIFFLFLFFYNLWQTILNLAGYIFPYLRGLLAPFKGYSLWETILNLLYYFYPLFKGFLYKRPFLFSFITFTSLFKGSITPFKGFLYKRPFLTSFITSIPHSRDFSTRDYSWPHLSLLYHIQRGYWWWWCVYSSLLHHSSMLLLGLLIEISFNAGYLQCSTFAMMLISLTSVTIWKLVSLHFFIIPLLSAVIHSFFCFCSCSHFSTFAAIYTHPSAFAVIWMLVSLCLQWYIHYLLLISLILLRYMHLFLCVDFPAAGFFLLLLEYMHLFTCIWDNTPFTLFLWK